MDAMPKAAATTIKTIATAKPEMIAISAFSVLLMGHFRSWKATVQAASSRARYAASARLLVDESGWKLSRRLRSLIAIRIMARMVAAVVGVMASVVFVRFFRVWLI